MNRFKRSARPDLCLGSFEQPCVVVICDQAAGSI
jgi:hypothetical protein